MLIIRSGKRQIMEGIEKNQNGPREGNFQVLDLETDAIKQTGMKEKNSETKEKASQNPDLQ